MQNLIVFGATGGTGNHVVGLALDHGYQVTAVVRNPDTLPIRHPNLHVIKGDVLQPATFEQAMEGQDAVISVLGARNLKPTTVYSEGVRNIIAAMQRKGISRIAALSAGGLYLNDTMGWLRKFFVKSILQPILKESYADLRIMEKELQATNLQYSIIRPPRLTRKALTGKYRFSINTPLQSPNTISRADLAHYLLAILENKQTFKSIIEVAY